MMKTMRKMTHSILWIVIAAFVGTIVFAWGMQFTSRKSKQGVIAVVNGKDIPVQSFQYLYENKLKEAEKKEEEVTDQVAKNLRDQTWTELVDQTLLSQEVKKRGIVVTNKELYEFMKRFPPREIMESEVFQTNGQFDYNKYRQALADQRVPWGQIEGYVRSQLLIAKLQETIIGAVRINDQEVYRKYVDDTQKARLNYIFIPAKEFSTTEIQISPAEIEKYFKENLDKFKMEERAAIRFVVLPKNPSKDDEEKTRARILEIRDLITSGEDFAEMAKEYSEDPTTRKNGGDLGWLKKGATQKPFDEALFALKPGEISEPVKTEFGWHLIKVLEKKKTKGEEEFHASHILLKIEPSEETLTEIKNKIDEFVLTARKVGFDIAASDEKLPFKESGLFVKGSFIPKLGLSEEVNQFVFENKPGKISDPIESQFLYYVVQIKERKPAGIPSLSEAELLVKDELLKQKLGELAYQKGMRIYEEIRKGKDFKKMAEESKEKVMDSGEFTRNSFVPGIGQDPEFIGSAFALSTNQISPPVKTDQGTYILQLFSKSAVNDSTFKIQGDSLTIQLLRKKQSDFYTQWFENLKKSAKIEDFRNQYYKETF
ncbi:MAG: peptidylprolyl isomerase [candidate division Zixibacteria bacterium]|nr:peptidylprolyl isomerase [candidate division Zixibacteria bacterium]